MKSTIKLLFFIAIILTSGTNNVFGQLSCAETDPGLMTTVLPAHALPCSNTEFTVAVQVRTGNGMKNFSGWELIDNSTNVVVASSPLFLSGNTFYGACICVPITGCYNFKIYNDGDFLPGSGNTYEVAAAFAGNDNLVASGGPFTASFDLTSNIGACCNGVSVDAGSDQVVIINTGTGPPDPSPCAGLLATASGGTPPYAYQWTPTTDLNDATIAGPVACPTVTTSYTVVVADANGFMCADDAIVTVVDIGGSLPIGTCPGSGNQIQICHLATCTEKCVNRFGNCPSPNSLCAHLLHGDNLGPCGCKMSLDVDDNVDGKSKIEINNHPNPFSDFTTIVFTVPQSGRAILKVYNMVGSELATLFDETVKGKVSYSVNFDVGELPEGIYFYSLENGFKVQRDKMVIVK